jgi:hypothetical protein
LTSYVIAFGFKPRASINSGDWSTTFFGMWVGTLYFNIVGCSNSANPAAGLTTMTTPPAPHFTISNTEVTSQHMIKHWVPPIPIYIPAGTKFTLRSTWAPGTIFNEAFNDHYGTGNLIITGTP